MRRLLTARAALLASLGILSLNYAFTGRYAQIPGSIHGRKEPLFVGLLCVTVVLALRPWPTRAIPLGRVARAIGWLQLWQGPAEVVGRQPARAA